MNTLNKIPTVLERMCSYLFAIERTVMAFSLTGAAHSTTNDCGRRAVTQRGKCQAVGGRKPREVDRGWR